MMIEVASTQLRAGDRIHMIRTPGIREDVHDNIVKAPESTDESTGNRYIPVHPDAGARPAKGVDWNFWLGTSYEADSIFQIERQ